MFTFCIKKSDVGMHSAIYEPVWSYVKLYYNTLHFDTSIRDLELHLKSQD